MPDTLDVLILEDNVSDAKLIAHELRMAGFDAQWRRVETERDYLAALDDPPDIVLADYNLPQFSVPEALALLRQRDLDIPVIVITGSLGDEQAAACIRQGAADYLLKDRLGRLGEAVRRALEEQRLRALRHAAEEALRASEEALRQSEARYRQFSELTSDYCYALDVHHDRSTTVAWATASFTQLTGRVPGDVMAPDAWARLIHADDLAVFLRQQEAMRAGGADAAEFRVVTAGGDIRWLRHHVRAEWDEAHERLTHVYGAAQDITEYHKAGDHIRFQASLLENAGEAVIATDLQGQIIYWNRAAEDLYGWAAAETLGRDISGYPAP